MSQRDKFDQAMHHQKKFVSFKHKKLLMMYRNGKGDARCVEDAMNILIKHNGRCKKALLDQIFMQPLC